MNELISGSLDYCYADILAGIMHEGNEFQGKAVIFKPIDMLKTRAKRLPPIYALQAL
jgi:hypothetical protein